LHGGRITKGWIGFGWVEPEDDMPTRGEPGPIQEVVRAVMLEDLAFYGEALAD